MVFAHDFDGKTYDSARDKSRLNSQLECVLWIICDGEWHTLAGIHHAISTQFGKVYSEAGISARLRDLRKERFGELEIDRRNINGGLWEYRLAGKGDAS